MDPFISRGRIKRSRSKQIARLFCTCSPLINQFPEQVKAGTRLGYHVLGQFWLFIYQIVFLPWRGGGSLIFKFVAYF
jgi:hypothetical protein